MMMISQCATFQPWSATFIKYWVDAGYMTTMCDIQEVQDLLDFQRFTASLEVKMLKAPWRGPKKTPDVVSSGVPLSSILVAHHNLVTYGVPFETWTNPQLPNCNYGLKRYYAPHEAISALSFSELFRHDAEVHKWITKAKLETPAIAHVPGMTRWVEGAKLCFSCRHMNKLACAKHLGDKYWEIWADIHQSNPEADVPPPKD